MNGSFNTEMKITNPNLLVISISAIAFLGTLFFRTVDIEIKYVRQISLAFIIIGIIVWSLAYLFEVIFEYRWKYWEIRNLKAEKELYDLGKILVTIYIIATILLYVIGLILMVTWR